MGDIKFLTYSHPEQASEDRQNRSSPASSQALTILIAEVRKLSQANSDALQSPSIYKKQQKASSQVHQQQPSIQHPPTGYRVLHTLRCNKETQHVSLFPVSLPSKRSSRENPWKSSVQPWYLWYDMKNQILCNHFSISCPICILAISANDLCPITPVIRLDAYKNTYTSTTCHF